MKKYDILVVTYNNEKYLSKCIDSIMSQTYKDFNLIIVDDGSIDTTKDLVDRYIRTYDNISYYYKENTGVADTRNYAISLATSEYFTFVDSDDYISKDLLKYISKYTKDGTDIISFDYIKIDENYTNETPTHKLKFDKISGIEALIMYNNIDRECLFDVPWGYFYRTEYFKKNNLMYLSGTVHEDIELTPMAILNAETIKGTDFLGYYYVQTSKSITRDYSTSVERFEDILHHYNNLNKVFKKVYDDKKITLKQYASLTSHMLIHILYVCCISDYGLVKKYCKLLKKYKTYKLMQITYVTKIIDRFIFHHLPIIPIIMYNTFYGLHLYNQGLLKDGPTLKYMYSLSIYAEQNKCRCPDLRYRHNRLIYKLERDFLMIKALIHSFPALKEKNIYINTLYINKNSYSTNNYSVDQSILNDIRNIFKLVYKIHQVCIDITSPAKNVKLINELRKFRIGQIIIIHRIKGKKVMSKIPKRKINAKTLRKYLSQTIKDNPFSIQDVDKYYIQNSNMFTRNKEREFNLSDMSNIEEKKQELLNFLK